jgi:hypothetical protein
MSYFFCCLWGHKLQNTTCTECEEEITFTAWLATWQHVKSGNAACHDAKLSKKGEWSKWATPKEIRELVQKGDPHGKAE